MRQIFVYDNSLSTCMGNFHKTEYFLKIVMVCYILFPPKNYLELNLVENIDK